ncbi:acyl-CoA dehydrogenase family protein [soil metagenome]
MDTLAQAQGTDFYLVDEMLTDDELSVRDRVRAFADKEVVPHAAGWWERAEFPNELLPAYAALGVAGGSIHGHGCPGLGAVADGLVVAELARGDGSVATFHGVHSGLAMRCVDVLGSADQKERWLPAMARAEQLGAFALTEPTHGSDVVRLETRAERDGDGYLLHGEKRWIGLGSIADIVVVWARDDNGDVGGFVVEHGPDGPDATPGYTSRVITGKTSNRALWQADVRLDGVRVPTDNRLTEARSFADTSRMLAISRQGVAWEAFGHAVAAYEYAVGYARTREQFGAPIAARQLIQDKLSRMLADITGMQLLCLRLAQLQDGGKASLARASLAKLHTAAAARRVCAEARDILGGNGILLEHHVARHHADMEAVYTYEGTDTVQSLIVGREITGLSAFA